MEDLVTFVNREFKEFTCKKHNSNISFVKYNDSVKIVDELCCPEFEKEIDIKLKKTIKKYLDNSMRSIFRRKL